MSTNFSSPPYVPGQLLGTQTNDNAAAGMVGEFFAQNVTGAVSLTTNIPKNLATPMFVLTAGDWDIRGYFQFSGAATTTLTDLAGCISTVTNTMDTTNDRYVEQNFPSVALFATFGTYTLPLPPKRLSINSSTSIYFVANANFAVSTLTVQGHGSARRIR